MARSGALLRRLAVAATILAAFPLAVRAGPMPRLPTPAHIVVVVMENHSYRQIMQGGRAPFIASLAARGALFTNSFAVTHPSQPNYFALFSGSTHGVEDDDFHEIDGPTLAGQLRDAGKGFVGFVERDSPRQHNPWESFRGAGGFERDFADFPKDFAALPPVSFVIPDPDHDMHDGSIAEGDAWLRRNLGRYALWAAGSNDLLIVTFDEDDDDEANRIPTVFSGGVVKPGRYGERIDHYSVLRTIEAMEGLPPLGEAAKRTPIADVWKAPPATAPATPTRPRAPGR